jgi:hypothetical protein
VGTLKEADSGDLHEFRQVISVDGRPVQTEESARRALSLGMQSRRATGSASACWSNSPGMAWSISPPTTV